MSVRRLTSDDETLINNLMHNRTSLFKRSIENSFRGDSLIDNIGQPKINRYYGYFTGESMVGITKSYLWKTMPYYTLTTQFLDNPTKSISLYKRFINEMLEEITREMEEDGRFTYYTVTLLRPSQKDQFKSSSNAFKVVSHIKCHKRYDCYVEAVIPPNSRPSFQGYSEMLGNKVWPVAVSIKRFSLKFELRKKYFEVITKSY